MFTKFWVYSLLLLGITQSPLLFGGIFEDMCNALNRKDKSLEPLKEVIRSADPETLKREINGQGSTKRTLLHYAVDNNREDLVELLLDAGIDYTLRDIRNDTAFDRALDNGRNSIVAVFLRHFPDLINDVHPESLATPLTRAILSAEDDLETVHMLVEQFNAPVEQADIDMARARGNSAWREYLEEHRALQEARRRAAQPQNLTAMAREHAQQAIAQGSGLLGSLAGYFGWGGSRG